MSDRPTFKRGDKVRARTFDYGLAGYKPDDVFIVVSVNMASRQVGLALEESAHSIRSVPIHRIEHVSAIDRLGELA